ncbi:MAG: PspA-associated protein PspAB [Ardenticatenaceae bacterium]
MLDKIREFINALLGRNAAPAPSVSKPLFAINTALIEMEARLGVKPTGFAALAFRQVESSMFQRLESEIQELVKIGAQATQTQIEIKKDEYNYLWLLLYDEQFEDLVATMHLASSTLEENDFGRTLLSAAFQFRGEQGVFFWLYNFKRGLYYPFAPRPNRTRDQMLEMRLKSLLSQELPIESDHTRWYPLWDIPGDREGPRKQLRA